MKSEAASAAEINADANATLHNKFALEIGGARGLGNRAAGVLVFPSVIKAGFGFGGEYGEPAYSWESCWILQPDIRLIRFRS
jgi:lipid-binding SYLF domain-containing protein